MSTKKKFKETAVGKLLLGAASVVNPTLGKVLEGVVDPKQAIAEITKSDISVEDKIKLQQLIHEGQQQEMIEISSRWKADLEHGNWLTRSVRPMVLLFLIFTTVLMVFIDSGSIAFEVDEKWTDLLQIVLITVIGAYFGGRSIEKVRKK
jgi:hypothetical protein|tara:strand:- start:2418 stop:2864 length:447 start_codon:yes stop_codon:yes gene_type:complete